ncbi:hypothetical protein SMICM17S_08184 [Streptomyces microflavus]
MGLLMRVLLGGVRRVALVCRRGRGAGWGRLRAGWSEGPGGVRRRGPRGTAPPPEVSTTASTLHWALNRSARACLRTSSLPLLAKLSRAPALMKPIWSVVPSNPVTWAFWLSRIQVKRRLFFTASRMSGHMLRTWPAPWAMP